VVLELAAGLDGAADDDTLCVVPDDDAGLDGAAHDDAVVLDAIRLRQRIAEP
jgi:hypothetical protein